MSYLQCSEVNHIVDIWVFVENRIQCLLVCYVTFGVLGLLTADQFNTVKHLRVRVVGVVYDDDFIVGLEQGERSEGTDVACATDRMSA